MTYISKFSPADAERRETERRFRNQTEAHSVLQAATALHAALERSGGIYSTVAMHRLLDLCIAVLDIADGDVEAQQESLMWELGCDQHGNPVSDSDTTEAPWSDADKQRVFGGYR